MSTSPRRPLAEMAAAAAALVAELSPYCTRIEIAGSIRRKRPECGDIELVCVPRRVSTDTPGDLFARHERDLLSEYVMRHMDDGDEDWRPRLDVRGRMALGPRYKRLLWCDIPVDLFSVLPPAQWGMTYLIRTGPAEFSRRVVTPRDEGGLLPSWLFVRNGAIRYVTTADVVETPEEADVFRVLGIPFVAPEDRA